MDYCFSFCLDQERKDILYTQHILISNNPQSKDTFVVPTSIIRHPVILF